MALNMRRCQGLGCHRRIARDTTTVTVQSVAADALRCMTILPTPPILGPWVLYYNFIVSSARCLDCFLSFAVTQCYSQTRKDHQSAFGCCCFRPVLCCGPIYWFVLSLAKPRLQTNAETHHHTQHSAGCITARPRFNPAGVFLL